MAGRAKTGGKTGKVGRCKAKSRPSSTVVGRHGSFAAHLQKELDERTRELTESIQQQKATSEVLSIIRQSPADAQPVFDAIVQSATRLCNGLFGVVYLYEDGLLRIVATNNFTPAATIHLNELQQLKKPHRSHLG